MKPRSKPLSRRPLTKRRRKPSEFARIYHSKERVAFVQALACFGCASHPSQNAHTVTGGMGRKADFDTIIPLCDRCHRKYDGYEHPYHKGGAWRDLAKRYALRVQEMWANQCAIDVLHTTDPLCARCKASFREEGSVFCGSCQELNRQERPERARKKPPRDAA